MTVDLELTLNRFGFRRVSENKVQVGCFRVAWWRRLGKHSIGFEVNWKVRKRIDEAWAQYCTKTNSR